MHDPLDMVNELAAAARREPPPTVDLAGQVLAEIREARATVERPLAFFAVGSLAAAALVAVMSASLLYSITDPLAILFQITPLLGE
jgi:hypothetical protein